MFAELAQDGLERLAVAFVERSFDRADAQVIVGDVAAQVDRAAVDSRSEVRAGDVPAGAARVRGGVEVQAEGDENAKPVTSQALPCTTILPPFMVLPAWSCAEPKTSIVGPSIKTPRSLPGVPWTSRRR